MTGRQIRERENKREILQALYMTCVIRKCIFFFKYYNNIGNITLVLSETGNCVFALSITVNKYEPS